jgi:Na+/H+ antiporter family
LLVKTGEEPGTKQTVLDKIENGNSFTALLWGTFGATVCTMLFYLLQWFKDDGKLAVPSVRYFCQFLCAKEKVHHHVTDEYDAATPKDKIEPDNDMDENDEVTPLDRTEPVGVAKPLLSIPELVESFLHGMGRIFPALIVLTLAWAVGSIMVDVGANRLFSRWIVGGLNPDALPTLSFLISFLMAVATGTSWGTMTILFPLILVPTYQASGGDPLIFYATTAGVLSGSVAGDHVSPISDTTVLSALSCDCQLLRHVLTQTPYVVFVVLLSVLVGTVPVGYNAWPNLVGIFIGLFLIILFSKFVCAPIESPTGRYDIFTELRLMIKKDPELLQLKEHTIKYFAVEADVDGKVSGANDDVESTTFKKGDDIDEESDEKRASHDDETSSA